jgi:cysteine desulfurase
MPIYLDYNASTPVAPQVRQAMAAYEAQHYGNPHTAHWAGKPAHEAIENARREVAETLGCAPDEIYFTGGATEANNWAIKGAYFARRGHGDHLIISSVEHPSVKLAAAFLEKTFGASVTRLPVDRLGRVDPTEFARAITPRTILAAVMHAQNEVGTVQPIAELAAIARRQNVPLLCDVAQSLGKIPVHVAELGADYVSIAGHKLYAPKGVGALYIRKGSPPIEPLLHGAGQEAGQRGGTENTAYIVGLGAACELYRRDNPTVRLRELRDYFWEALQRQLPGRVALHGDPQNRLPNTLNVGFRGAIAADLLDKLEGIAASPGSACHYGKASLSATLAAMNVDPEFGLGAIRWSLGRSTTRAELDEVVGRLCEALG